MSESIGLIAGKGQFPLLFARAARDQGVAVVAVAPAATVAPICATPWSWTLKKR